MTERRQELPKMGSAVFGVLTGHKQHLMLRTEETPMITNRFKLAFRLRTLLNEEGQDLIEYALVVALIAFAATAGMSSLAASINNAFLSVGTTLSSYIT
jgi:pilus assembly protein Flp/PilA